LKTPASLVARAARTGEIVWVENVREAKDWLPNPLLPDTYSEMAVPIIIEGQVVGVLDVQQNRVAGLDEGDAGLLRSLANQVAVTIRNARLFNKVETALAEARAIQEQYMEQAWEKIKIEQRRGGQYVYVAPKAAPLDEAKEQMMTETRRQVLANKRLEVVAVNGGDATARSLVAPITVHAKTIGALQLHTSSDNPSWSGDDLAVIEAVVDQLAQTADNLRLFDETRNRVGREQTIREITEKMRTAISLDQLVKIAAEELGQRLSAGHAVVEFGIETDRY
jgi:GAF domain-containing protein